MKKWLLVVLASAVLFCASCTGADAAPAFVGEDLSTTVVQPVESQNKAQVGTEESFATLYARPGVVLTPPLFEPETGKTPSKTPPVEPEPEPVYPDPTKPMVALTFDDGPSPYTDRLLDYFDQFGGKGTFFLIGRSISGREETVVRMAQAGHEIGGHSWNHPELTSLSNDKVLYQFTSARDKIYEVTGVMPTLVRPPYGSVSARVKGLAGDLGIVLINWSVDTLDWKYLNANKVYNAVMRDVCDGAIILCHDLHKTTVDAMERVIPDLLAQGYQLVTVSELMAAKGIELVPGTVYRQG